MRLWRSVPDLTKQFRGRLQSGYPNDRRTAFRWLRDQIVGPSGNPGPYRVEQFALIEGMAALEARVAELESAALPREPPSW